MVICGSYIFEFSVNKDMNKKDIIREMTLEKVATHICLTLIVKNLKNCVKHGRAITSLNIIKH